MQPAGLGQDPQAHQFEAVGDLHRRLAAGLARAGGPKKRHLVTERSIRNPCFRKAVEATRRMVYRTEKLRGESAPE